MGTGFYIFKSVGYQCMSGLASSGSFKSWKIEYFRGKNCHIRYLKYLEQYCVMAKTILDGPTEHCSIINQNHIWKRFTFCIAGTQLGKFPERTREIELLNMKQEQPSIQISSVKADTVNNVFETFWELSNQNVSSQSVRLSSFKTSARKHCKKNSICQEI